jgi:hypothetical protein
MGALLLCSMDFSSISSSMSSWNCSRIMVVSVASKGYDMSACRRPPSPLRRAAAASRGCPQHPWAGMSMQCVPHCSMLSGSGGDSRKPAADQDGHMGRGVVLYLPWLRSCLSETKPCPAPGPAHKAIVAARFLTARSRSQTKMTRSSCFEVWFLFDFVGIWLDFVAIWFDYVLYFVRRFVVCI